MALTPEQSLALSQFTDFKPLVDLYLDQFTYLVLFDPTNALVSDYTPTMGETTLIDDLWKNTRPEVKDQLAKIIKFVAVNTLNTAGEVIILLRAGAPSTVTAVFDVYKAEIPKIATNLGL